MTAAGHHELIRANASGPPDLARRRPMAARPTCDAYVEVHNEGGCVRWTTVRRVLDPEPMMWTGPDAPQAAAGGGPK
jgi:hypothetical protein